MQVRDWRCIKGDWEAEGGEEIVEAENKGEELASDAVGITDGDHCD